MTGRPKMNDATLAQISAARPDASTWLGANAGSGKTRVLTDRVARLLFDNVNPQNILCLTYTKAAASEMQNRLFKRLGEWAMLDDAKLRTELWNLGVEGDLPDAVLNHARTLFASAIEAPGGLKIQTIHSFCAGILRRFPLEAGVSPQFTEIEERAASLLQTEIVDDMAEGPEAGLVSELAAHYTSDNYAELTAEIVRMREKFSTPKSWPDILEIFGLDPADDEATIRSSVFLGGESELLERAISVMKSGSKQDQTNAEKLAAIPLDAPNALAALEDVFLTKSGESPFTAKVGKFPTKATQGKLTDDMSALENLMLRVEQAREKRVALAAARKSNALHNFSRAFLLRYAAEKLKRGWLDFDDLILKTRALLSDKNVAAWVLFRIDGGIDHILVDEAQDTSPAQWDVIEKLTDEFGAGQGARENEDRTLFVVGDKKQSIYSFQGADPREFDTKREGFESKITGSGGLFQQRSLAYSFRSSAAILRVVDACFGPYLNAGFSAEEEHIPFKLDLPGRVDLWPVVEPPTKDEPHAWFDPIDRASPRHQNVILAQKIAENIASLIKGCHTVPDEHPETKQPVRRPISAGDFLILVQRRSPLFSEIIRACKTANLPIAGADRLKVGAELAVRDLAALLSFLATPEDSLNLATALRSPIFGWTEQNIFDMSHRRTSPHLWQALRGRSADYPVTLKIIQDLRAQTDFLRPYDLIERVLIRHDGRAKLLGRLGAEAEDGIDALLSQALAYERNTVPSLTGFLGWMETDELEIKRQIDNSSDQIRVMTVHGAKGLEAPIVILPDCGNRPITIRDEVVDQAGFPIWKVGEHAQPHTMRAALEAKKQAEREERQRLLYVAMTRAEKWLIVAAAGKLSSKDNSWYQLVEQAMIHSGAAKPDDTSDILRVSHGDWDGLPYFEKTEISGPLPQLDSVFRSSISSVPDRPTTISPSEMEGAKALPGEAGEQQDIALSYGTFVHALLEKLPSVPEEDHLEFANCLASDLDQPMRLAGLKEAQAIISKPGLAEFFGLHALTEAAISAELPIGRIHGVIDKLIVKEGKVLAVDFKTNRTLPDTVENCPLGVQRQMAVYARTLETLYPEHEIQTAILWTKTAELMVLPHDIVTMPLGSAPHLDDDTHRS